MDRSMAQLVMNNEKEWNYCDFCENTNDPNWKCIICDVVLCENCKLNHTTARKTKLHKIISYQEQNNKVYLSSNLYCKIHPENKIILCCEECDIPVCDDCVDSHSTSHKFIKIKTFARKKRTFLVTEARTNVKSIEQNYVEKCMENLTTLEKQAIQNDKINDRFIDTCVSTLKDVSNSIKTKIKNRQENMCEMIEKRREIINKKMEKIKDNLINYEWELSESDYYVAQHANETKTKMKIKIPEEFETIQEIDANQENIEVEILETFLQKCSHLCRTSISINRRKVIVAGLHLGTYMSGCSFSSGDQASSIFSINASSLTLKPLCGTSILLDQNGQLHSYGEEAVELYLKLASQQSSWYFFNHFPKELCSVEVPFEISTTDGRMFEYGRIYISAISYFRQQLFNALKPKGWDIRELAEWVITVPTSANKTANNLIKEAAKHAGIQNNVMVVTEAEAASCCCREAPMFTLGGNELSFMAFMPGNKQLIINTDSEMVNFTVLEVMRNGRHKIISTEDVSHVSGVIQNFENCLQDVFGEKQVRFFQRKNTDEYNELMEEFKTKIRSVKYDDDRMIKIHVRPSLNKEFLKLKENITQISSEQIQVKSFPPVLCIKPSTFKTFFDDLITQIVKKVKTVEKEIKFKFIILVGEMAESEILQRKLRSAVPSLTVLVPPDPKMAILTGAVLYGQTADI